MPTLTKPTKTTSKPRTPKASKSAKTSGAGNVSLLQSADLKHIPWLVHGFSTRPGGLSTIYGGRTLNLGFTKDDERAHVERNRKTFLSATGAVTK
ncbi:MAG TPA: hypothetical protein VKU42_13015, partial [Candidatus Angelobacter sp.]|nr:hypothetical protein [Candidatus Angelobacter sp.]